MNWLQQPKPFLFDGAFGTYYAALAQTDAPCELANLTDPDTVIQIHREYIAAGAHAIKTNTFACHPQMLPPDGSNNWKQLLTAGYANACHAVEGTDRLVFADIGPIADGTPDDYLAVAEVFLSLGATHFLFETQPELDALIPAFASIKQHPETAILVSFAAAQDGLTRLGQNARTLLRQAAALETVDAVGLNCICGPAHLVHLVQDVLPLSKPFSAMPNAGYPTVSGGRMVYLNNTSYYADKLSELAAAGCAILGGCCGTTPRHIRAFADLQHTDRPVLHIQTPQPPAAKDAVKPNVFRSRLSAGKQKVVAVEIDPPQTCDFAPVFEAARLLQSVGVDVLTFADSPLSRTRADSMATAAAVSQHCGIPVMPHLTCRDRNQIALKGSLIAANALGVSNVLALTGDPISNLDGLSAKGVFSMNSFGLTQLIHEWNDTLFSANPFYIGGALNLNAAQFDVELRRAERKCQLGARYFLTQPIYSETGLTNLHLARQSLDAKLLAGIFPVASYKNALFLNNEVSGIDIPDDFLEKLRHADPSEVPQLATAFALQTARDASPDCDGFYLMTPLRRFDIVQLLAEQILDTLSLPHLKG